jgi:uncharacterized membrane protein (UPF0136 family)
MTLDPITLTNLVFCAIILILGIIGYKRSEEMWPLFIGIAFGLFGVTHLLTLLDLKEALATLLLAIRIIAYLMVALTVFWVAFRR